MDAERIVIVGGGPGGLATARSYRECGGSGSVTMLSSEPLAPYRRPPLSKEFLRGEAAPEDLAIEPPGWYEDNDVCLRLATCASALDPAAGRVTLCDGAPPLHGDAIVIATGSQPTRPPLPGADHPSVLTVRTLADSRRLLERAHPGTHAAVVGTGFIGCEIAASLALREVHVTLIGQERLPQLERLGEQPAQRIAGWLVELGVQLRGGAGAGALHRDGIVELRDGERIAADCVILGAGVRPRGELAERAGLDVADGAVVVDESMLAGAPRRAAAPSPAAAVRVLAVGDVALARNASAGRRLHVEHWGDALAHGEVAGRVLAGQPARWDSVPGFWTTIGGRTLKYAAWGDGHDEARTVEHAGGGFTTWYSRRDAVVGVLTYESDTDYERGRELVRRGAAAP